MAAHKQPRQKHVPQRTCLGCRLPADKRGLIRIVRTPEGAVVVDPTGKRNGRGAYLCHRPACWEKALKGRLIEQALRTPLSPEDGRQLAAYRAAHIEGLAADAEGVLLPSKEG
jgi:predicted RNA-binding protein YlxR (DUF448 family)